MAFQMLKVATVGVSVFAAAAANDGQVPEDFIMIYTGTNSFATVKDERPECAYDKAGLKMPDSCCDVSAWEAADVYKNFSGAWTAPNQVLTKEGETAPNTCFVYQAMENAFTDKWARSYIGCENGVVVAAENCIPSGTSYTTDAEYAANNFTYPMNATFGQQQWENGTYASCGCDKEAHFNQGPGCYSAANTMAAFAGWLPAVYVRIDGECSETLTCGELQGIYRDNGCCGMPDKTVQMDRRLSSAKKPMDVASLKNKLRQLMQRDYEVGAEHLEDSIVSLVESHINM